MSNDGEMTQAERDDLYRREVVSLFEHREILQAFARRQTEASERAAKALEEIAEALRKNRPSREQEPKP